MNTQEENIINFREENIMDPQIENLLLKTDNSGGGCNISYIFENINNSKFRYLKGEISNDIYIFEDNPKKMATKSREQINNTTNDKNLKHKSNINYEETKSINENIGKYKFQSVEIITNYLAYGGSNVVFRIKNTTTQEKFLLKIRCDKLDENYNPMLKNKYREDKATYGSCIPNIYKIGYIKNDEIKNNLTFYYHITKEYNTNFENMSSWVKLKFFIELTKKLKVIQNNLAYVRDLKIDNVAYDLDCEPVFIDYDFKTIEYYKEKKNFKGHTYFPYYAVILNNRSKEMDEIYIKINIFGYVDILLNLFFEPYLFFNICDA